jgi:hypothetical protein
MLRGKRGICLTTGFTPQRPPGGVLRRCLLADPSGKVSGQLDLPVDLLYHQVLVSFFWLLSDGNSRSQSVLTVTSKQRYWRDSFHRIHPSIVPCLHHVRKHLVRWSPASLKPFTASLIQWDDEHSIGELAFEPAAPAISLAGLMIVL